VQIALLKFLDRFLGAGLARVWPSPAPPRQPWRGPVLFIRPGGIGDAVHLVPAIRTLQRLHPECAIDVLAEGRNAAAFALCPGLRTVYRYDRAGDLLHLLGARYGIVIDTEQWHRLSALVARVVRSDWKIGFATNARQRLFTHRLDYAQGDYERDSFFRLLEPLGVAPPAGGDAAFLTVPLSADLTAAAHLRDYAREFVAIFPGASVPERHWGAARYREVARRCLEQGLGVVVVGGSQDREEATAIAADLPVLDLAGRTSLTETAAVLARAAVVVSADSGVLHIAVGLGRPTVSLFGSGIAPKWAPRGSRHIVLNKNLLCSPCTRFGTTPICPHNVRCMQEISVEDVTNAIRILVGL